MVLVQSGNDQYLVARTPEFDQIMAGRDQYERQRDANRMNREFEAIVTTQERLGANKTEAVDAAMRWAVEEYGLVYYRGTNGHLSKQ